MRRGFDWIINFLLPPLCITCKDRVNYNISLCGDCWVKLEFVEQSAHQNKFLDHTSSVLYFDDFSKKIVHELKYKDRMELSIFIAKLMMQHSFNAIKDVDYIVPIPMHINKLRSRKYNQAALIARNISEMAAKPLIIDGLKKIRNTQNQVGLKYIKRTQNLEGAFAVNPFYIKQLQGTHVLLIDDVITTGTTIEESARVLKANGVSKVYASVFLENQLNSRLLA